jgi:hypothetical protein
VDVGEGGEAGLRLRRGLNVSCARAELICVRDVRCGWNKSMVVE